MGNIYIHIPFCESKCKYCRFASVGNLNRFAIAKYVSHLCDEIRSFQGKLHPECIYFGGGTPSVLEKKDLEKIFLSLNETFDISGVKEISFETTPQNVTEENVVFWKEFGINRISMGVQSLHADALQAVGRHDHEIVFRALDILEGSQIPRVSVDFIIGLPGVPAGGVVKDISLFLDTYKKIQHISCYMLEDYYDSEEDVLSHTKYDGVVYPDSWKQNIGVLDFEKEYAAVCDFLKSKNFYAYEISNFSQPGYECVHNSGYWNHTEVIGFGLGAYSFLGGKRFANSVDFSFYYDKKLLYEETLTSQDYNFETLMFQLRTSGISQNNLSLCSSEKIEMCIEQGLLFWDEFLLKPTYKGITLLDTIIQEIYDEK